MNDPRGVVARSGVERKLGKIESTMTLGDDFSPMNAVVALHLAGAPSPDRLRDALAVLQARHPLLRTRVSGAGGRYRFELAREASIPLAIEAGGNGNGWIEIVERELNTGIDRRAGPLVRCAHLEGLAPETGSHVVLSFHHAVVDGVACLALLGELLRLWAGKDDGLPVVEPPMPAAEAFFPPAFRRVARQWRIAGFLARQLADEIRFRRRVRRVPQPAVDREARNRILPVRLDESLTSALSRRARRERVTLASAIGAAMLLGVHRLRYESRSGALRHIVFADLRPHLKPPLDDRMGVFVGMNRFTMPMSPTVELWTLARELNERVRISGRRGEAFLGALLGPLMVKTATRLASSRVTHTALSYAGAIDLSGDHAPIEVRGLNAFVSNGVLGPLLSALARWTKGELWLDFEYVDCDMSAEEAAALVDEIRELLAAAG